MKNFKYSFIKPSEIYPQGWLKRQLEIQASGLSGNLDKVWPDIRDSAWIGDDCDGWERVPYWLDGFIPLAFLLRDEDLISRARRYIDAIIERQKPDGWICPCTDSERGDYDMWAAILIGKVLTVWADFADEQERIEPVLRAIMLNMSDHIDTHPLKNWGAARWFEGLIPLLWLYRRKPDERYITLAYKLEEQGFRWKEIFADGGVIEHPENNWTQQTHVVNISMVLKSDTLMSLFRDGISDEFAQLAYNKLQIFNGMASGHFTGDECLGGISPIRGSELCSVVEAMYSYELLLAASGDISWAERLEDEAFNALPAAFSPDMWTHQYDQMTNQVQCSVMPEGHVVFGNNSGESNVFGLEPNFGCCTANLSQGFPKFAASVFMRSNDGIVCMIAVPAAVKTEINGVMTDITISGEYPFRDSFSCTVNTAEPVSFTLGIRIPGFAKSATVNGECVKPNSIYYITKQWCGTQTHNIVLEVEPIVVQRPDSLVCVKRGALLYSLPIIEKWERVEYVRNGIKREFPYCDYYIYPQSDWQYGFASDKFVYSEHEFTSAFETKNPAVSLEAELAPIKWGFDYGYCHKLPDSLDIIGSKVKTALIPYGATCLRMTEMPMLVKK